jgi:hypothetical protein
MMGSDAAIFSSDSEPSSSPSPSALWPGGHIVVEQAWPNKGRACAAIRHNYEIVSVSLPPKNSVRPPVWLVMH